MGVGGGPLTPVTWTGGGAAACPLAALLPPPFHSPLWLSHTLPQALPLTQLLKELREEHIFYERNNALLI
jgi:hypothetical protein